MSGPRVCVSIIAVLCTVYLIVAVRLDDLGFVYDGSHVLEVDPGGAADRAGLRVGDLVVADPLATQRIDNDRDALAWAHRNARMMESGAYRFDLERDHHRVAVTLIPGGPTLATTIRQLENAIPSVPIAIVFFAIAALFARRARREHPARARFAIGLALAGSYFVIRALFPYSHFTQALWSVAPACSVIGFMLVAQGVWALSPISQGAGRALHAAITTVGVGFAVAVILDTYAVMPELPLSNLLQWFGHAAMFGFILAGLTLSWRRSDDPVTRGWARSTLVLVAIGLLLPLVTVAALGVFIDVSLGSLRQAIWQLFALVPIALGAAASRESMLELEGRLPAVVLFAVSFGCALLIYIGLEDLVDASLSGVESLDAARMVGFAIVITVAEPLRTLLRRGLDHLFARDRTQLIARCSQLCAELARVEDAAAIEIAVRNVLHVQTARLCPLEELISPAFARELTASGALRISDLTVARVNTLVHITGSSLVLGLEIPLAQSTWDDAVRQALASVGQVIGSMMQERDARRSLEARVVRDAAERRGIAMELHDGIGATLTAARLLTQMVRRSDSVAPVKDTLDGLETTIQAGLHDLRIALWGLDEHAATWGDLIARLRRQLGEMCKVAGIALDLTNELADDASGGPAVGLAVYRIVQEAATNTVKHARAKRIVCSLRNLDDHIELVFEDDGVGLPSQPVHGRGIGNIRRRVAELRGALSFTQPTGGGTRIVISLPLRPHEHARDAVNAVVQGDLV